MSNYSGFSGFKEGERLPPNTYVCVIESERPTLGGRKVKGERGVAYKVKDDPDNLYVIGDGWYWRGPASETKKFEVKSYANVEITLNGTMIDETFFDILKQQITLPNVYSYKIPGGTISASSYYMNQPLTYTTYNQTVSTAPKAEGVRIKRRGR